MDSEIETIEKRLKSFISQVRTEYGILDRMVYKNKNQHRRCCYFQYLLKVRRDLRLLQSAKLEEIVNASFHVISANRPKQKVQLLESLKRKRGDGDKYNFLERLLGVARLLSQMVEPMLKAAIEISTLLARSFFMGFSLTILSLLARLRVLVQQILLDVVWVFNTVSSVSQKGQAVKLNQQGFEVFREYYPTKDQAFTLECIWQNDKFLLIEKKNEEETKCQGETSGEGFSGGTPAVQYQSIEVLLADGESSEDPKHASSEDTKIVEKNEDPKHSSAKDTNNVEKNDKNRLPSTTRNEDDEKRVEDGLTSAEPPGENTSLSADGLLRTSDSARISLNRKSGSKDKVAFISIKRPAPSTVDELRSGVKVPEMGNGDAEDSFFSLLTGGNMKSSIF